RVRRRLHRPRPRLRERRGLLAAGLLAPVPPRHQPPGAPRQRAGRPVPRARVLPRGGGAGEPALPPPRPALGRSRRLHARPPRRHVLVRAGGDGVPRRGCPRRFRRPPGRLSRAGLDGVEAVQAGLTEEQGLLAEALYHIATSRASASAVPTNENATTASPADGGGGRAGVGEGRQIPLP